MLLTKKELIKAKPVYTEQAFIDFMEYIGWRPTATQLHENFGMSKEFARTIITRAKNDGISTWAQFRNNAYLRLEEELNKKYEDVGRQLVKEFLKDDNTNNVQT